MWRIEWARSSTGTPPNCARRTVRPPNSSSSITIVRGGRCSFASAGNCGDFLARAARIRATTQAAVSSGLGSLSCCPGSPSRIRPRKPMPAGQRHEGHSGPGSRAAFGLRPVYRRSPHPASGPPHPAARRPGPKAALKRAHSKRWRAGMPLPPDRTTRRPSRRSGAFRRRIRSPSDGGHSTLRPCKWQ